MMTTLSSTTFPAPVPSVVRQHRTARLGLWIAQLAVAGLLFLAGSSKLAGAPEMVGLFNALGVGQWFRYATGAIEVLSATALLVPSLALFGALLVVPTMIGAIATHVLVVGGSAAIPAVLLAASLGIIWARRHQLSRVVARLR
jgi:hypothetical protein